MGPAFSDRADSDSDWRRWRQLGYEYDLHSGQPMGRRRWPAAPMPPRRAGISRRTGVELFTVVATVALVPFIQSLATQAGVQVLESLRRRRLRRAVQHPGLDQVAYFGAKSILVVEERAGVSFLVPGGLPNDALDALTRADLMALAAPDPEDGKVVIWWDGDSREWRRSVEAG